MVASLNENVVSTNKIKHKIIIMIIGIIILIIFSIAESLAEAQEADVQPDADTTDVQPDMDICYENKIAITFDDGPGKKTTVELLDGLKERGVKATFFLIGKSAEANPEIVKRMYDEGHLIGSHTYSHVQLDTMNISKAKEEIDRANSVIESITGQTPKYIRPPYGKYSDKLLASVNMTPVLWTVDPVDWNTTNTGAVVKKVVSDVKCGDIILLHDIYKSSVTAALEIIDQLQAKGFIFVTVDQLLLE